MKLDEFQDGLTDQLEETLASYLESDRKSFGEGPNDKDKEDPSITKYLKGHLTGRWEKAEKEQKLYEEAQKYSSDVGSEGGVLIHPRIEEQIIPLIRKKAVIRGLGPQVVDLPNTNTLTMQRQTQASEAVWIGESEDIEDNVSQEARWGDLELTLRTVAGFARLPNTLLNDATPAADELIRNDLAKVLALAEDYAYLEGTGGKEPLGIRNRPEIDGKSLGNTLDNSGNGFDDLIDMQTAIENNGGEYSSWLMNPTMKGYIRKLVDSDDRNIWQPGNVREDEPEMLLGLPVYYSRQIPVEDSDTYIVLADWSEFLIIQKNAGIALDASKEAAGAFENNQTVFRAVRRVSGGPRVPENFYILDSISTS